MTLTAFMTEGSSACNCIKTVMTRNLDILHHFQNVCPFSLFFLKEKQGGTEDQLYLGVQRVNDKYLVLYQIIYIGSTDNQKISLMTHTFSNVKQFYIFFLQESYFYTTKIELSSPIHEILYHLLFSVLQIINPVKEPLVKLNV